MVSKLYEDKINDLKILNAEYTKAIKEMEETISEMENFNGISIKF